MPRLPHGRKGVRCPAPATQDIAKRRSKPQNFLDVPQPATANELSSKKGHGALVKIVKRDLWKRANRGSHFVRACAVKMHMDIARRNFYARNYSEKAGDQRAYPDLTPAFNTYRKNPSVWTRTWTLRWITKQDISGGFLCSLVANCKGKLTWPGPFRSLQYIVHHCTIVCLPTHTFKWKGPSQLSCCWETPGSSLASHWMEKIDSHRP